MPTPKIARATYNKDALSAIEFASQTPGPVLIEFVVEKEDSVYPMVPAGADLDAMIRRPILDQSAAAD